MRLLLIAAVLAALAAAPAEAARKKSDTPDAQATAKKPKKAKKSGKKGNGQVGFYEGSAESKSERSDRLRRECKGQVNAGACAGYTR